MTLTGLFGAMRLRPIVLLPRRPNSECQVGRTLGYLEGSSLPLRSFNSDIQARHNGWARCGRRLENREGIPVCVARPFVTD